VGSLLKGLYLDTYGSGSKISSRGVSLCLIFGDFAFSPLFVGVPFTIVFMDGFLPLDPMDILLPGSSWSFLLKPSTWGTSYVFDDFSVSKVLVLGDGSV